MSTQKNRDAKLRKKRLAKKAAVARRVAFQRDGRSGHVVAQNSTKGYNVAMIRDFLDHLLLEVRVQHKENVLMLRKLQSSNDLASSIKVANEPSPAEIEQFIKYQSQYESALIEANAFNDENATMAETTEVIRAVMEKNKERRDEQIGHLEALQELFDEALACAKLPFGFDRDGNRIQPCVVRNVRELIDEYRQQSK